jgi:hypothetical protein
MYLGGPRNVVPGDEGRRCHRQLLFGDVNPSGKLPTGTKGSLSWKAARTSSRKSAMMPTTSSTCRPSHLSRRSSRSHRVIQSRGRTPPGKPTRYPRIRMTSPRTPSTGRPAGSNRRTPHEPAGRTCRVPFSRASRTSKPSRRSGRTSTSVSRTRPPAWSARSQ